MRSFSIAAACVGCALSLVTTANAQRKVNSRPQSPDSGSWQRTSTNPPGPVGVPILMTDGTVICHSPQTNTWYKLTPTSLGSYRDGTWSTIGTMSSDYGPLYFASSVLADGRVVVIGGEYNLNQGAVWTNKGSVYNPATNTWTSLAAPSGWSQIGDAQCQVMPDGRFLLAHPFDKQLSILDPGTLQWTNLSGTGKLDRFDEEGWVLLPDGTIMTCDAINAPHAEKYIPSLDTWVSAGDTPQRLEDSSSQELGPMVLMPDGKVFAFGATGHNAIYTPGTGTNNPGSWVSAPDFPNVGGQLDIADGPAVLLPNGHILAYTSPGVFNSPSHFYEWDGTSLLEVANVPNSSGNPSYVGNFLILPNGQVMFTDFSKDVEIYSPTNNVPNDAWRPTISAYPSSGALTGKTYIISGTQFNGLSNGSAYGDDSTNNSNYPLVRITNSATGHVRYCKTHDHSTMAVATGSLPVSTFFDIPSNIEKGPSVIEVVCNGIASAGRSINIGTVQVAPTSYQVLQGIVSSGNVASLAAADSDYLNLNIGPSRTNLRDTPFMIQINGISPVLNPSGLGITFVANVNNLGPGQVVSMFNFLTNAWEEVDSRRATTADQTVSVSATGQLSRFVNQTTGEMRVLVTYKALTAAGWQAHLNQLNWTVSQ
ncbi:MAG: hypothetical protein GC165_20130 [Armatimonadetes bacterium]|nr:hypothetical protein [Armatimonadota bacterium]